MYQESFLQELFDGILRSLFVAWLLFIISRYLRLRFSTWFEPHSTVADGIFFGVLTLATMALPLPVTVGHTVDLRVIPIIFSAPASGFLASATAVALGMAGQLTLADSANEAGMAAIVAATIFGWGVAWWMGWRLRPTSASQHPLRPAHVIALALGTVISAAVPEVPLFDPNSQAHVEFTRSWLLYFAFLPGASLVAGAALLDFTRRREVERMLRAEADRTATIAANIPGVLYQRTKGSDGRAVFRYMSPGAVTLFGLDPAAITADANVFFSRVHPDDLELVSVALERAQRNPAEAAICEFRIVRPDGRTVWIQTRSQINREVSAQLGQAVAEGMAIDITDRKLAEAKAEQAHHLLLHAADHDALTGLPNRQGLAHWIANETHGPQSGLVVILDLRNSKLVNELFGSSGGDKRLIEAAHRLQAVVPSNGIVARTGDDEFTIVTSGVMTAEPADEFVRELTASIDRPFRLSGQLVPMRADIGYVLHDGSSADWDSLVRAAATALEDAQAREEASAVKFGPEVKAERSARLAFDLRLAEAIDAGEMSVFWQPICDASNGVILGREALVRWFQPDGRLIMPGDFVPRAEATGLWPKLDALVLHRACEEAARWDNELWISVNMSPGWLMLESLREQVSSALLASGLSPERLCIEVTERALVDDCALASRQIGALRDMGVSFAIDDFGTGYSSLSYLSRLPIRKLKIDKSFIDEIETNRRARYVVESIIELCNRLDIESLAEGVETERQREWLHVHGCKEIQGYIFGRPERL